ncbi:LysR substrate-binding domain-containing protein [Robbsia sp. KACC 23696]|uniref:LysR family transcriptional regulator n=1 Tax=Robbsia sp. KACC 23696 TaxID=3149231 RepID=UPI00325ABC12
MTRDLNDTLAFVRVVEAGSFTAAASALQIPKTTISRRVQALERHLGAQLLHRTTRKLRLTEAGSAYFEQCAPIVRQLAAGETAVHRIHGKPRGWLRVTLPYSFGVAWIAPLIAGFRTRYPDVRLELLASHVPIDMYAEDMDVALRLGVLPDSTMIARRLGSFATGVYASPRYLTLHGKPETPMALKDYAALALHQARSESGYSWPMQQRGRKAKHYAIDPFIVASDPAFLLDAARAGQGLILGMDEGMAHDIDAGRLCRVLPARVGPPQELNAVFPGERLPSPKVRAFIDYLKERLTF